MTPNKTTNYWCEFKVHGGNGKSIRIPFTEIRYIIVDPENLQSKLFINGKEGPLTISNTPAEIEAQTQQKTYDTIYSIQR